MSQRVLGIAIGRHAVTLACVKVGRWKTVVESSAHFERVDTPAHAALARALEHVPPPYRTSPLHLALSAGDLNCADCFDVPFRSEAQLAAIAGSLAEERCAGGSVEEMAIDHQRFNLGGTTCVRIVALAHATLDELIGVVRKALPGARLRLVTASVAAQADVLREKTCTNVLVAHGEALLIRFNGGRAAAWRSFPVNSKHTAADSAAAAQAFSPDGTEVTVSTDRVDVGRVKNCPVGEAAAVAVSQLQPQRALNVLRGAKGAPRSALGKLRGPLTFAGAAAALLLLSTGLYFSRQIRALEASRNACDAFEENLWHQKLPNEKYVAGGLSTRVNKLLLQHNKTVEANKFPSALAFWSEIAAAQPDADRLGFALDSMQLGLDGGRMSGRVLKGASDPLSNASQLEIALEKSPALSAHGEFENGPSDVAVRLRLDYPKQPAQSSREKGLRP